MIMKNMRKIDTGSDIISRKGVRRRVLSAVLACLMLMFLPISLVSCHGSKELAVFSMPDGLDPEKEYNITFWAKNDSNPTQVEIYNKAVEDFESLYPNIHVTLKRYSKYDEIYRDVITNISTGTTPNVCITYPDHIATYISGENTVVPLDELISDSKYGLGGSELLFDGPDGDEIIPAFLSECYVSGELYAIPFMRSTEALYINGDMVEALGYEIPPVVTWDFVFEVSEAALAKNDDGTYKVNGQNILYPFIYKSTDNMMIQMLKQREAGYSTSNGKVEIFNDDTKEILLELAGYHKTGVFNTFAQVSYPGNLFNKGQCIFAIDSTAGATWMGSNAPLIEIDESEVAHFETVVRPVPQCDVNDPKMISQGPSLCIFNKEDPEEVLASWLFAQYLLTDEIQIGFSSTEGYVPVTSTAQSSPEYLDYLSRAGEDNDVYYDVKINAAKLLLDYVDYSFITPVFNGSAMLRSAAGELIEGVIKGNIRHKTVDDKFIDELFEESRVRFKLDNIALEGKIILGELPPVSVGLLITLCALWILVIAYAVIVSLRSKKRERLKK